MIIDYLTITIVGKPMDVDGAIEGMRVAGIPDNMLDNVQNMSTFRPYTDCVGNALVRLHWNHALDWASLQITGHGCKLIPADFVSRHRGAVTRVDFAWDGLPYHPSVYEVGTRDVRTRSYIKSDNGTTLYIGSRKSDGFVRIYQYNPPHERAGITRCEVEFKGSAAKNAIAAVLEGRVAEIAAYVERKARLEPGLLGGLDAKPLRVTRGHKGQDGRERWLHCVCIPAIRRAIAEGVIAIEDIADGR